MKYPIKALLFSVLSISVLTLIYIAKPLKRLSLLLRSDFFSSRDKISRFYSDNSLCRSLQTKVESLLADDISSWSISVLNRNSDLVLDINGSILRIPASNQKIYTTAYALNELGPNYHLKTNLYKNKQGYYEITGSGNPDFNKEDLADIASIIHNKPFFTVKQPAIYLYEEPQENWWPNTWTYSDRKEAYGSPITRLSISSNSDEFAVLNPLSKFKDLLSESLNKYTLNPYIIDRPQLFFSKKENRSLIYSKSSAPLYMLLSLSNSESHNFTSEVLLKTAAGSWNTTTANKKMSDWLNKLGVTSNHITIADGSGLSRSNKTTTRSLVYVLNLMNMHKHRQYYLSSMSLLGVRGTLRDNYSSYLLHSKFLGKSGTLNGVRSLSGYLLKDQNMYILSMINNNQVTNENIFNQVLSMIYLEDNCN